jgi:hypothetical protein
MALRRIELVFVLWDDLKLTSGLRTPTAFNGQNYFFKTHLSVVLWVFFDMEYCGFVFVLKLCFLLALPRHAE